MDLRELQHARREPALREQLGRARGCGRDEDAIGEREHVGTGVLGHRERLEPQARELAELEATFAHEQRALVGERARRLQVQPTAHLDRHDCEPHRTGDRGELAQALGIGALREPDQQPVAPAQHVAAIEPCRLRHADHRHPGREHLGDRRELVPPRRRAGQGDERTISELHGRVLDEHGIGRVELGQHLHVDPRLAQRHHVAVVLAPRERDVDRPRVVPQAAGVTCGRSPYDRMRRRRHADHADSISCVAKQGRAVR